MKTHVRVLVCGDEQVGKSSFISTVVARHFPDRVPHVMADVSIPPEENLGAVHCTICDSSALPDYRGQLVANLKSAGSIVLMYDVERMETLARLNSVWLPLIETHTKDIPVVIVRNKVDRLTDDPETGGRSDEDLRRQMAPLRERYRFFHTSLECSSITQHGLSQVFHHALTAALYPIAPLYDTKLKQLRPKFERALRRLFRLYDRDRDGLLSDAELNNFQYRSFNLLLSEMDIVALKKILARVAERSDRPMSPGSLVVPASGGSQGGIAVDGFLALMSLFIEKNQMKAPWKTLQAHDYDDNVKLLLPRAVLEPPAWAKLLHHSGGSSGGGVASSPVPQVFSADAEAFLVSLFDQFSCIKPGSTTRLLTSEAQAEIFDVIPDPACAPWDPPRAVSEFDWRLEDGYNQELFGRLRRAPGSRPDLTLEGWMAHWEMLAAASPVLARAHLFYAGFHGEADKMLVAKQSLKVKKLEKQRSSQQVFLLGARGSGRGRVLKALKLGEDLLLPPEISPTTHTQVDAESNVGSVGVVAEREGELEAGVKTESVSKPGAEAEGEGELEAKASVEPGAERVTKPAAKAQDPLEFEPDAKQESVLDAKTDDDLDGEPDPDPDAEPEFPQTCAAFACGRHPREERVADDGGGSGGAHSSRASSLSCRSLSLSVTEVPEDRTKSFLEHQAGNCELAVLVFDPSSMESLNYVTSLQAEIPGDVPRLVVACENSSKGLDNSVLAAAEAACQALDLSLPIHVNPDAREGFDGEDGLRKRLANPERHGTVPHAERRRKRKDMNRKLSTAALIATAGIAVVAVGYYTFKVSKGSSGSKSKSSATGGMNDSEGSRVGGGVRGLGVGIRNALSAPIKAARFAASVASDYWKWRR